MSLEDIDCILLFDPQCDLSRFDLTSDHCKVVSFFHDAIPLRINEGEYWRPAEFAGNIRRCAQYASHFVCDSESSRSDLITFFGEAMREKSSEVILGHDASLIRRRLGYADSRARLKKLNIDLRHPYFVMLGAVEERKNVKNVLRAMESLHHMHGSAMVSLVVMGQHMSKSRYDALLGRLKRLGIKVHVLGYVPDETIPIVLHYAAGLLFPSLWEGFGLPILEAMSAETPVVTSSLSSMPEVGGKHAFYCDPYEPSEIAAAMHAILKMKSDERTRHVKAAADYAADFTWERTATQVSDVIQRLLKARDLSRALPNHESAAPVPAIAMG